MMSAIQKSLIAETIQGARASLHEPSRPFTPGDLPRHLFQGDDYQNRPGSSYKMNSVVGQAMDEFQSAAKQHTSGTQSTMGGSTPSSISIKNRSGKASKQGPEENVLDILSRAEALPKRAKFEPHLLPKIGGAANPRIGSGLAVGQRTEEQKGPIKIKQSIQRASTRDEKSLHEIKEEPGDHMKSLSSMMQAMTE